MIDKFKLAKEMIDKWSKEFPWWHTWGGDSLIKVMLEFHNTLEAERISSRKWYQIWKIRGKELNHKEELKSCLHHCLDQWVSLPDYNLWYNSNHVILIEKDHDLSHLGYLPFHHFGRIYFIKSFKLNEKYTNLLIEYFNHEN